MGQLTKFKVIRFTLLIVQKSGPSLSQFWSNYCQIFGENGRIFGIRPKLIFPVSVVHYSQCTKKNYTSFSFRTKTQFFQVLCEEVMSKAMKMIDVDKIFLSKSNEGAVNVLNALKVS